MSTISSNRQAPYNWTKGLTSEQIKKAVVSNAFVGCAPNGTPNGRTTSGAVDPRNWELSTAINMYGSPQSVPFFRALMNERQFPMTAKEARAFKPVEASTPSKCPTCVGTARTEHLDWLLGLREKLTSQQAFDSLQKRIAQVRDLGHEGCERHEVAGAASTSSGGTRPERSNVLWTTYLADRQRMVVTVRQSITKTVQVSTGIWKSEPKLVTTDRWFVVMAEQIELNFGRIYKKDNPPVAERPPGYKTHYTDKALAAKERAVANEVYFRRGVPLSDYADSWTVLDPVEEFHGPFSSEDEARLVSDWWAAQVNDDLRDQRKSFEDVDHLASVS